MNTNDALYSRIAAYKSGISSDDLLAIRARHTLQSYDLGMAYLPHSLVKQYAKFDRLGHTMNAQDLTDMKMRAMEYYFASGKSYAPSNGNGRIVDITATQILSDTLSMLLVEFEADSNESDRASIIIEEAAEQLDDIKRSLAPYLKLN